jgi:glycosyltransferase involved in cell wall biosynthesis
MRLLYLCADPGVPIFGHKGASVHMRELASAFVAKGAAVVVASPRLGREGERMAARVELAAIDPVLAAEHSDQIALRSAIDRQAEQITNVSRAWQVDAIYERFSLFSDGGIRAAGQLGLPHALEVNAPLRDEARRFRTLPHERLAAEIESAVLSATNRVFAVSDPLARRLRRGGLPADRVAVTPNGIDPARFAETPRKAEDRFTIGFAGSLKPWHGIDLLLEAFRHALAAASDLRLEIAGDGPLAAVVREPNLPDDCFSYLGRLSHRDTIAAIARWHVGVAPFLPLPGFYFSPLKVVEYMAAGTCPIASDIGQIRTLLGVGKRGVLVEPGSAEALAAAIVELARRPDRAAALAAAARAYALRFLTWEQNAERILQAFTSRDSERAA